MGGANVEDDNDLCLYIEVLLEDDIVADRRDMDDFKEASRTIAGSLTLRTCTLMLQSLSLILSIL
jgi:hypothetical protein